MAAAVGRRFSAATADSRRLSTATTEGGDDRVVVAVRLRPWINEYGGPTPAERSRCCIRINASTAEVVDPRSNKLRGRFTFDHCFDSFDARDTNYASQQHVFEALAPRLITSALQGYNVTVFAYGQTASGKSYTMLGSPESPGFMPRFVESLFDECAAISSTDTACTFEASYLEIHKEAIHDLLNPTGKTGQRRGGLRVREHPRTGPYVEDLAKVACTSADQVQLLLEHGTSLRTIAQTKLNVESSRSHAIFTLKLTQRSPAADVPEASNDSSLPPSPARGLEGPPRLTERVSRIHLVDLAGSERAKKSGGHRLQETGAINKSLSTLGAVISALAAGKRTHVPYRESVLTYLLKDSLGGNARTVVLATVSPAASDFSESLSTMRYADSAKAIVNHATPNLDPSVKLVMQLKGEIEALRAMLAQAAAGSSGGGGEGGEGGGGTAAIAEQLMLSEKLMAEAQMSWNEKLRHAELLAEQRMGMVSAMEEQVPRLGLDVNPMHPNAAHCTPNHPTARTPTHPNAPQFTPTHPNAPGLQCE